MKIRSVITVIAASLMFMPFTALGASQMEGMDHGKMKGMDHEKMDKMDHGKMKGMDHGGMKMEGDMVMLGEETEEGAKAMAHIKDVKEAMGKMGMKETHHFMVMFMDTETGKPIESGTVALKIEEPGGKESGPVKMMGMEGHFGADIVLTKKGEYHFKVGTKLADGKKRQYHFHYTVE